MQSKFNQHYVPRQYLKGFACDRDSSHIWEYDRARNYFPGSNNRAKYNPVRISLAKAGASLGEYALQRSDGIVDFNTYENALEQLEKPADAVFAKIRNQQDVSNSDREILAAYMATMTRRVPARKDLIAKTFPSVLEDEERRITELLQDAIARTDLADIDRIQVLKGRLEECRRIFETYKQNGMPREMELRTMVEADMPRVRAAMLSMTWQFFVATDDERFFTGDNPVHAIKDVGFSKPYSELTFPISSLVALVGTYRQVSTGYLPASSEMLKEVNRRIIASAKTFVYGARDRRWILTIMQKNSHRFNLYYPAPELSGSLVV